MHRRRHRHHPVQPTGLLTWLWRLARGTEQILVRPAGGELPLVTIAFPRGDRTGASELEAALSATWLTIPTELRALYTTVLTSMPPMVVVEMRRRNACGCLGHFHPRGTESVLTTQMRIESSVDACEMDLAYEAIQAWRPAPLAHTAVREAAGEHGAAEFDLFRFRLALLDVFLHELHHRASPDA